MITVIAMLIAAKYEVDINGMAGLLIADVLIAWFWANAFIDVFV